MKQFIQKNLASSGLGLALLLLVIVAGASYRSITQLLVTDKWVKHTYTVLEEIDDVLSALKDAEQGRRDYILTKNETFLETFELGEQTIERKLKTLRYLTADNPRQQQQLDNLQPLVEKRLDSLRNSINLPQQNRSNFNMQVTLSQKDIGLQAQIRKILDDMDAQERELLQGWSFASQISVRNTIALFVVGYAFSFGLLLGVFWLLQQRIRDRQKAEQAQQESEERWQLAIKGNNDGIWDWNIKTNQTFRSPQFREILGYEDHELGNSNDEWSTRIHPDDFNQVMAANRDYLDGKIPQYAVEHRLRCKDGTYKWVISRGQAQWDKQGKPVRMVGSTRDITKRKQAEAALHKLNAELEERVKERTAELEAANQLLLGQKQVLEMIATGASLPNVLNVLIRTIEKQSPQILGSVLLLDPDGRTLRHGAAPSLPESYNASLDGVTIGPNIGSCGTAAYRGQRVIVSDIALDPLWSNSSDLALSYGLRSCWSQPVVSSQGKILGTFAVYYREPRFPSLKDLQLIETAAHIAGIAIERKQIEQERSRLVAILEATSDHVGIADAQGNILWNNAQAKKWMGLDSNADVSKLKVADYHPQWALEVIQNQGIPGAIRDGIWMGETALLRYDGGEIPVSQMIIAHKSPDGSVKYFSAVMRDISQRKQAEAALRESYNLLQTVIDSNPSPIFVKDLQGRYLLMNAPGASLFNKSIEEIVGQDDSVLFPPEVFTKVKAHDYRIISSGSCEMYEETLLIQGEWRTYLTTKNVYRDAEGNILGLVGFARDITYIKQTQEVLKESEERFRATFEQAAVGIAHVTPDGQYLRLNQKFCDLLGYTQEEMLARTFQEITYPDDLDVDLESLRMLLAGEIQMYSMEKRYIRKDNSLIWTNLTVSLVRDSSGKPKYNIGAIQDISSLKETQEALLHINGELEIRVQARTAELSRANAALAESEELLRLFIENAPSAIAMFDRQLRYLATSKRWLLDYQLGEQDIIGHSHYDVFPQIPERWKKDYQNVLKGVVIKIDEDSFFRADGILEWLRYELHPWYNSKGEVGGIIMFMEVITKRKEAERKLQAAIAELARSNQELEQFAYVASHDLREPLRKIKSYTDLLVKRYQGQLDEKADKYIAYITDGAVRMQALIIDLLTYSRVGRGEISLEPTDLGVVLKRTLSDLSTALEESNAHITTDPLPTVRANSMQMGQLLQNLIANAIKFRGKESPHVQIRAVRQDKTWTISVQDNGIGIEPQYAERIFVIFQRLHMKEEYPGTGIGLAVCKKIVERHGGQIWVESELGRGTTFFFTLSAS